MDYEDTADCIKSCIVSVKGGLPLNCLEADFKNITGETLNPQKLGFANLRELLISIKEIYLNGNILTVKDPKTEHLSKLIEKQKGQTKFKTAKKPVPRFESRVGNNMKRMQPRLLRESQKKLIGLKESQLLPDSTGTSSGFSSGTSAMTTQNLQQFDRQEEGAGGGALRRGSSPFGSTSSLGTGKFSLDDGPGAGRPRGRGRGWSSNATSENPGGLSGNATPRRETSSPDVRSYGSESVSRVGGGGGGAFSSSSLGEVSEDREPMLFRFQLIGEHFLTKVASLILGFKVEASDKRLCCSSLDIATCLKRLKESSFLSEKVILMLGLTDIMKGKDLDAIKPIMVELLEYLRRETKQIVVVTIPVPPCLKKMPKPLKTLLKYNEWLLSLKFPGTRVIDILPYTQNKHKETYDFLCDSGNINAWNETACWTLVEALFFSGICV